MDIKRGEIYYADLDPVIGSEQGGRRPVLILQNDVGNHFGPTVIVAAISTKLKKAKRLPTHVSLPAASCHLGRNSVVFLEQLRTIDKKRVGERVTMLDKKYMDKIDEALRISMGLVDF